MKRLLFCVIFLISALASMPQPVRAEEKFDIRIGLLKFGTVNWEMNVIASHGLAAAEGVHIQVLPMANLQATKIALQGGSVDMIVADWLWVTRQRDAGADFTFVPYSRAIGAVIVPELSEIKTLADLKAKRLGIAGGPLDKSWLMLRALVARSHGFDLDDQVEKVFAAPPLLSEQLLKGRLDALITFWHFAARLEAKGYRSVARLSEIIEALDVPASVPIIGFTFSQKWADANRQKVEAFMRASRRAKNILATSNAEWDRIQPITRAKDAATLTALREGYRAGIPESWGGAEREGARTMYDILSKYGGEKLVGPGKQLASGTFWSAITY